MPFTLVTTDRGDVMGLLDAAGAPFASYRIDQWGRLLTSATAATGAIDAALAEQIALAQVLRYAGYAYDAESGLYYCSARYYDPALHSPPVRLEVPRPAPLSIWRYRPGLGRSR